MPLEGERSHCAGLQQPHGWSGAVWNRSKALEAVRFWQCNVLPWVTVKRDPKLNYQFVVTRGFSSLLSVRTG